MFLQPILRPLHSGHSFLTYLNSANIWVPRHLTNQTERRLLAILVPAEIEVIDSETQYLELLAQRVAWLIHCRLEASPTDLKHIQRLLQLKQHQLNPDLWSVPSDLEITTAEDLNAWREGWARVLVRDCGAIQNLLIGTVTEFPQAVNLGQRVQEDLRAVFQPLASGGCDLEEWLNILLLSQIYE